MNKETAVDEILSALNQFDLKNGVEVLANVFLNLGLDQMTEEGADLVEISPETIADAIIKDVEKRGETLGNALARQGLTMMIWLEQQ